jgi:hypothetical protein
VHALLLRCESCCAGDLTLEQLQSLLDARTFVRLKELLDGLSTIGLLTPSLILTDSSGRSGGLREARWTAKTHALVEESEEAQGSRHAWNGGCLAYATDFQNDPCSETIVPLLQRRGLNLLKVVRMMAWPGL